MAKPMRDVYEPIGEYRLPDPVAGIPYLAGVEAVAPPLSTSLPGAASRRAEIVRLADWYSVASSEFVYEAPPPAGGNP